MSKRDTRVTEYINRSRSVPPVTTLTPDGGFTLTV